MCVCVCEKNDIYAVHQYRYKWPSQLKCPTVSGGVCESSNKPYKTEPGGDGWVSVSDVHNRRVSGTLWEGGGGGGGVVVKGAIPFHLCHVHQRSGRYLKTWQVVGASCTCVFVLCTLSSC